jgi:translation initiation factor IF-3
MEVLGKVKVIGNLTNVSASFKKQSLVVTTEEQYPQFIEINFVQDKCDLLNSYKVGDNVKVSINLRGREWVNPQGETKYFNDIQGWRIEKLETLAEAVASDESYKGKKEFTQPLALANEPDNLPF